MRYTALQLMAQIALSVGALAQSPAQTPQQAEAEQAVAQRIASLAAQLDPQSRSELNAAQLENARERVTALIRGEATRFIESAVSPNQDAATVQTRLRKVLAPQRPSLEHTDPPIARTANLRFGRSLVAAYTIVRPPHFNSGSLSGFREDGGRYRLVATTNAELDGYTMFTHELPSPAKGDMWLLAGGQAQTFNGAKFRFRVCVFDGNEFEIVWAADDVFGATVQVTPRGFTITHVVREPPYTIADVYAITSNGVVRAQ